MTWITELAYFLVQELMFVFLSGAEGLGHFQPSLPENRLPAVPLSAARSNPRTRQLPLPSAGASPSWADTVSFSGGMQGLPGTAQSGRDEKRRGRMADGRGKGTGTGNSERSCPLLCSVQLHSETGGDWTRWLVCVSMGRRDREEAPPDLKCSWRRWTHLHDSRLLTQKTDHWGSQWNY